MIQAFTTSAGSGGSNQDQVIPVRKRKKREREREREREGRKTRTQSGNPVDTLSDSWLYEVHARTVWPCVTAAV